MLVWVFPFLIAFFGLRFNPTLQIIVYLIAAIGLGILLGEIVEQPMLRIRDRFFPACNKPLSTVTGALGAV